jgi:signal transduction histidine kinase
VDGRAKYVPGVTTSFHVENVPGFVRSVVAATKGGKVTLGTVSSPDGAIRYIASPVTVSGSPDSGVYVAAANLSSELADLSSAFATFWAVMAATLLVIAAAGWFVAGRLLRPLRTLRIAAANITTSSRGDRIPVEGRDDLAKLTITVNEMVDRLDQGITRQRQLLDDVRHELNTPIAIVMGHIETLDPYDPRDVIETQALAVDELERIAALVHDLSALAETEASGPSLAPVEVEALTRQVFAKASVLPAHEWVLGPVASGTAVLDARRITQAWLQLVDNASKYSPAGSPIELGSTSAQGRVEFWVADRGPGIPEEARERIFERFGRVESHRGIAGSGLGLPIVKAIALSHGGVVTVESSDSGTRFAIVVPLTGGESAAGGEGIGS